MSRDLTPHGALHIHTPEGIIVVPLTGDKKADEALQRIAELGGYMITSAPPSTLPAAP